MANANTGTVTAAQVDGDPGAYRVDGANPKARFRLRAHRGDGMVLLAMNWRNNEKPPRDFVGFAIEYREPGGDRFYALKNRLGFAAPPANGDAPTASTSTRLAPIQKFRWVHFPRNAEQDGLFAYRVTPVFMNASEELNYGEPQEIEIALRRDTYPGVLNVAYTRGFVSSQAFVDRYGGAAAIATLLPSRAAEGLAFKPTHLQRDEALKWMGFEARSAVLELLDQAIADTKAKVSVVAYDLNEPGVVERLQKLGDRVRVIIDDSGEHGEQESAESDAAELLEASAGAANVKRQHMLNLQHNKTIVVDGPQTKAVLCGSTNHSWRGFFVQNNHAVVVRGAGAVKAFQDAFNAYWNGAPAQFGAGAPALWTDLGLDGIDARVAFSPHSAANALLGEIADDIRDGTKSSLFYSLAFLYQTTGSIPDAIKVVTNRDDVFVYGMSDRKVGGLDLQKPDGNVSPVYPAALAKNVPYPFSAEPTGGGGIRMHHKFIVIDFDQPTARVYLGSYNFSTPADRKNGENLLLIKDRRIATSFVVEALRLFDHFHFRIVQQEASDAKRALVLAKPPKAGEPPWWDKDWSDPRRARDRNLFA